MVFSSNIFLFAFLPLTLFLYFLFPQKNYKNALLLFASLIFYAWGEPHYLALLLVSIFANYFFGIAIEKASFEKGFEREKNDEVVFSEKGHERSESQLLHRKSEDLVKKASNVLGKNHPSSACAKATARCHPLFQRGFFIAIAITFNLLLLGYFKYANFLIENFNSFFAFQIENKKIHLPIGISFFTFHAISYLVDIYRKKCRAQKNLFELALYISFFPQLVAGPIVRYNFIEKYLDKRRHNFFFAAYGIRRFVIGLGKKVIIANPLGEMADAIFNSPLTEINSTIAWVGIICYSLQIYFDFSGYSDMAVGLARIFGFKFPENFNYPYISRSIKEFWRRWHMSLSAWFRDYVYIPLGGNRVSLGRQYFNLVLVFFLCGLWHGASWNFIIWGMFHGFFLVIERIVPQFSAPKILGNFYAIFVVMIGWVFFRSPDLTHALTYLQTMFVGNEVVEISIEISRLLRSHLLWMSFIFALIGFSPAIKNFALKLIRKNKILISVFDLFLVAIFIFTLVRLSAATHNPFIYFQF